MYIFIILLFLSWIKKRDYIKANKSKVKYMQDEAKKLCHLLGPYFTPSSVISLVHLNAIRMGLFHFIYCCCFVIDW